MTWEIGFFIVGVGRRGNKGRNFKGMEMNVGDGVVVSKCDLANVCDSANIMDWYVV